MSDSCGFRISFQIHSMITNHFKLLKYFECLQFVFSCVTFVSWFFFYFLLILSFELQHKNRYRFKLLWQTKTISKFVENRCEVNEMEYGILCAMQRKRIEFYLIEMYLELVRRVIPNKWFLLAFVCERMCASLWNLKREIDLKLYKYEDRKIVKI